MTNTDELNPTDEEIMRDSDYNRQYAMAAEYDREIESLVALAVSDNTWESYKESS